MYMVSSFYRKEDYSLLTGKGSREAVEKRLLELQGELNESDDDHDSLVLLDWKDFALKTATHQGELEICEFLINEGASPLTKFNGYVDQCIDFHTCTEEAVQVQSCMY